MSKSQQDQPDQTSKSDWGLNDSASGRRSQVRVALMMIVSLLGALGYFVYRKYDERRAAVAQAEDFRPDEASPGPEATPESETSPGPDATPTSPSSINPFGPLNTESTEPHANTVAADHSAHGFSALPAQTESPPDEWSPQPDSDAEPTPQSLNPFGNPVVTVEDPVPVPQEHRDELIPADNEQAIDLFGIPDATSNSVEAAPADQRTVENERAIDLFGIPEDTPPPQETNPFEPVSAEVPAVENEQAMDLFGIPEEALASQATNPFARMDEDPTDRIEQPIDQFGNSEEPSRTQSDDPFEPLPAAQPAPDSEQVIDLFGNTEPPSTPQTTNPIGAPSSEQETDETPQPFNPFPMTEEQQPASTPSTDESSPAPFLAPPPASNEPSRNQWETQLPAGPTIEPVDDAEASADWSQEPDVIRVNSDQQIGNTARQVGFDDPFFPAEQDEEPTPESAPSIDLSGTPATLDYGTPAQPVPAATPDPAPAPSGDWSSQPGEFSGAAPSGASAGPPFATGSTTSASNSDPFAGVAVSHSGMANGTDDAVHVHTVRRGDSYWSIARHFYGGGRYFRALAAYNQSRIPDPNELQVGMKLLVPEKEVLEQRFPALLGGSYVPGQRVQSLPPGFFMSRDGQPMYRVGKNDTLGSIAEAHLGRASRWRQIYGMNRDRLQNADHLQLGLELRLPADASQAELVSQPATFR